MPPKGTVVLMGSGELTGTMVELYREMLGRLGPAARAVFLDTPAGFQLNADQLSARAVGYFRDKIGWSLGVASFKSTDALGTPETEKALIALKQADLVLVGPGSPTYAVRQWRSSPIPDILVRRLEEGACFVAASAAALTAGRFTLPVYEIYKVGEPLRWAEGIDVLGRLGLELTVVPHWNNAEGGTHDTRFCFMGESRFRALEALLPEGSGVLGIDEHTACIIDFGRRQVRFRGIGAVTFRRDGAESVFGKNDVVPLEVFTGRPEAPARAAAAPAPAGDTPPAAEADRFWSRVHRLESGFHAAHAALHPEAMAAAVLELERMIWEASQAPENADFLPAGREKMREWVALMGSVLATAPRSRLECLAPLVQEILQLRSALRRRRQWAEADRLRDCLERAGVTVEDAPEGARWRVRETP